MTDKDEMPAVPAGDKKFYKRGRDWEADKESTTEAIKSLGWRLLWGALIVIVALSIAVVTLVLRHKPFAFLVELDRATGETSTVMPLDESTYSYDEMSDKHDVKRYVLAREAYNYGLLQRDYDLTMNMSCENVATAYDALFSGEKGLDKVLGAGTEYRIKIISVRLPNDEPGKAVVSFEKTVYHQMQREPGPAQRYVSTLSYERRPSMKVKESVWIDNPRGFKVCAYRADPEAVSDK